MSNKFQIFKSVAKHLSFTKAAEELHLSQPAISKVIKNLEQHYNTTFFIRKRNSIALTAEGKSFLTYANKLLAIYAELDEKFLHKKGDFPAFINFGVSTTLSNYVIPKILSKFIAHYPDTKLNIISHNSENIEKLILDEAIDFGITEGNTNNPKLQFERFIKDEIVLVTNAQNESITEEQIDIKTLVNLPMVEREIGSGTKVIIQEYLHQHRITQLNSVICFDSTEGIKNYLYHSDHYALLSIHSIADDLVNNRLKIIDIQDLNIERWFYFVHRTGYLSDTYTSIKQFIRNHYNF